MPNRGARYKLEQLPENDTLRHLICKNTTVIAGLLCIRTAAAREIGGCDPTLSFSEGREFWCRIATLSYFVALADFIGLAPQLIRTCTRA